MKILLLIVFLLLPLHARAQYADIEQKKTWFYMQTLSKQVETIWRCIVKFKVNKKDVLYKKAWSKYYKTTNELSKEVEAYVKKYKDDNSKSDSEDSLRYRVWSVVIKVQEGIEPVTNDSCFVTLNH